MTNLKLHGFMALTGLSATALYAAQPPNPSSVLSDGFFNTAMGPAALAHVATPSKQCFPYAFSATKTQGSYYMSGCANTASGLAALDSDTTGAANTALGTAALYADTGGAYNTAVGSLAMFHNQTGNGNAALGAGAMFSNTTGKHNLATGAYALFYNTTGTNNIAVGHMALFDNTIGVNNVAVGNAALYYNLAGTRNTAVGNSALVTNTAGSYNTATGSASLNYNLTGNNNTANGHGALGLSQFGSNNVALGVGALSNNKNSSSTTLPSPSDLNSSYNVAVGAGALFNNMTSAAAGNNTAVGYQALYNNAGVGNTALGTQAGNAVTTGSYNTYIGFGVTGSSGDNNVTRIGANAAGTATTYIGGIWGTTVSGGTAVVVNANGQLGTIVSSERYKTDIASLGSTSERLAQLRPVSFHLKTDPTGSVQYGLIAEEVDKVYPELVVHDNEGRIQSVRYDELAPMLLNELQKQQQRIVAQDRHVASQDAEIGQLKAQLAEIRAALAALPDKDELVARR